MVNISVFNTPFWSIVSISDYIIFKSAKFLPKYHIGDKKEEDITRTMSVVKICGLKTCDAAATAIESGAGLLGVILVPNRKRTIEHSTAKEIASLARSKRKERGSLSSTELMQDIKAKKFGSHIEYFHYVSEKLQVSGPYLVGVFRNQSIEEILHIIEETDIDIVQLHGSEDKEKYIEQIPLPIIPRFVPEKKEEIIRSFNNLSAFPYLLPLLDSEAGGEGVKIDWNAANELGEKENGRFILAGGLNHDNVGEALKVNGILGVDVSGGVETDGTKDLQKIKLFIANARA